MQVTKSTFTHAHSTMVTHTHTPNHSFARLQWDDFGKVRSFGKRTIISNKTNFVLWRHISVYHYVIAFNYNVFPVVVSNNYSIYQFL